MDEEITRDDPPELDEPLARETPPKPDAPPLLAVPEDGLPLVLLRPPLLTIFVRPPLLELLQAMAKTTVSPTRFNFIDEHTRMNHLFTSQARDPVGR